MSALDTNPRRIEKSDLTEAVRKVVEARVPGRRPGLEADELALVDDGA